MNKTTRYKGLQRLWAGAKRLLAFTTGPRLLEERLRAQRWQEIQTTEHHLLDGQIRGGSDPDATRQGYEHAQGARESQARQAQQAARQAWQQEAYRQAQRGHRR